MNLKAKLGKIRQRMLFFLQKWDLFKITFCAITWARTKRKTWNLVNVCRKKLQKSSRSGIWNFDFLNYSELFLTNIEDSQPGRLWVSWGKSTEKRCNNCESDGSDMLCLPKNRWDKICGWNQIGSDTYINGLDIIWYQTAILSLEYRNAP